MMCTRHMVLHVHHIIDMESSVFQILGLKRTHLSRFTFWYAGWKFNVIVAGKYVSITRKSQCKEEKV